MKANVIAGPFYRTELFANFGTGFHSNDARAVILDPRMEALAAARGYELGIKSRPHPPGAGRIALTVDHGIPPHAFFVRPA